MQELLMLMTLTIIVMLSVTLFLIREYNFQKSYLQASEHRVMVLEKREKDLNDRIEGLLSSLGKERQAVLDLKGEIKSLTKGNELMRAKNDELHNKFKELGDVAKSGMADLEKLKQIQATYKQTVNMEIETYKALIRKNEETIAALSEEIRILQGCAP